MDLSDIRSLLLPLTLSGLLVLAIAYVLLLPDKAQKIAGWIWSGIARVWHGVDRRAVALRVEGEINDARRKLVKSAPEDLMEGKLKIAWTDGEEAAALASNGEVIVFMRRSDHHEENVAHALMAYLPKALLPRARRYIDRERMKAADFTVAKSILTQPERSLGALDVFYEQHLDPATLSDEEFARKNIFGGTVNAGPATMSYVDQMLGRSFPLQAFYEGGKLLMRALTPFRAGDRVTFQGEIAGKRVDGRRGVVDCQVKGMNQRGELVCLAEATLMLPR